MQKPDWKVAVVGGSIAALGLGGFAAAQQGGSTGESELDNVRVQRDASVSLHSLSSPVEVRSFESIANESIATSSVASLASVASVSVASLDSVPSVTPEPQPAAVPAPAPASIDSSIDSPSVASVASADSVDSSS